METRSRIMKIALPMGIILMGALLMMGLIAIKSKPRKSTPSNTGVLVRAQEVNGRDWQVTVSATGVTRSSQEVSIVPQVSGTVISISPRFSEGGFFKKGETLMKIDGTDYNLALRQALAAKARTEYEMEQIKSRADIARSEWEIISTGNVTTSPVGGGTVSPTGEGTVSPEGEGTVSPPNPLVLYEPQLKNARAALESAEASVEMARLNLERTIIRAPFACRIRTKNVDLGQYIRAGSPVAVVAGTDTAEVTIPLDRAELAWVDIPGPSSVAAKRGSMAEITIPGGAEDAGWTGRVARSAGEVDMRNRTVQIIVQVEDPYGLKRINRGRPPLMNGAFVNVRLKGRELSNVYAIPRSALRDDDTLWLIDSEGFLRIRHASVLRIEQGEALIGEGLEDGDRVVLTRVSGAADGMKLRTRSESGADTPQTAIKNATSPEPVPSGSAAGVTE